MGATLDGFKIRELFTVPHADDRTFVYGVNFEFSFNSSHWDATRFTSEIRPIVGWHWKPVDLIINPILDTAFNGVKQLDFAPATRLGYKICETWAVAAAEYADYGPVHRFYPRAAQVHQLYAVVDRSGKVLDVQVGVGIGLTDASDRLTIKVMLSHDLNKGRGN